MRIAKTNLKKQSQFEKRLMNVSNFIEKIYDNSVHWCWLMVNLKNKLVLSEVEWSQFSAGQEMA